MTLITGFCFERIGMLAFDSAMRLGAPEGRVRRRAAPSGAFVELDCGYATGGGYARGVLSAISSLSADAPTGLTTYLDRAGLVLSQVPPERPRQTWIAVLCGGPGGAELGAVRNDGSREIVPWGSRLLLPPPNVRRRLHEPYARLGQWIAAGAEGRAARPTVVQALARFYVECGRFSSELSGGVRIGVIVRPPGEDQWHMITYEAADARQLAEARSAAIERRMERVP